MTIRSLRASLLLVAAVTSAALIGCGSIAARPAAAARGMEVGIQDDSVFARTGQTRALSRERAFRLIRPLGVSSIRINVSWDNVLIPEQRSTLKTPNGLQTRV